MFCMIGKHAFYAFYRAAAIVLIAEIEQVGKNAAIHRFIQYDASAGFSVGTAAAESAPYGQIQQGFRQIASRTSCIQEQFMPRIFHFIERAYGFFRYNAVEKQRSVDIEKQRVCRIFVDFFHTLHCNGRG